MVTTRSKVRAQRALEGQLADPVVGSKRRKKLAAAAAAPKCQPSSSKQPMEPDLKQEQVQEPADAALQGSPENQLACLVEVVLCTCGSALYPHLNTASRRCLRLACKAGRSAVDGSVKRVEGHWEAVLPAPKLCADTMPDLQLPALVGNHWHGIKEMVISGLPRDGYRKWEKQHVTLSYPYVYLPCWGVYLPRRLVTLKLSHCIGSDEAWRCVLRQLPLLASSLRCLEISRNRKPRHECGALLPAALQRLTQLQQLRLEYNDLGYTGLRRSLGSLQQLRELVIEESSWWINPDSTDAESLADELAQMSQLQVLHLGGPLPVRTLVHALPGLTALQDLRFYAICKCIDLSDADDEGDDFADNEYDDGQLALLASALAALPELRVLGLRWHEDLAGVRLVQQLTSLQALSSLLLPRRNFGSPEAEAGLMTALPHLARLTMLDLSQCHFSADMDPVPVQAVFKQLTQLQQLNLSHSERLSNAIAPVLSSLSNLRQLQLVKAAPDAELLVAALQRLIALQHLDLSQNRRWQYKGRQRRLCPECCTGLLAALQRMQGLRHLDISQLRLGDDAALALAQALECATSLERLDISATGFHEKSAAVLAPALSRLTRLQCLWAGYNEWRLDGAAALLYALRRLPHLHMLDLCCSDLNYDADWLRSWSEICHLLRRTRALRHLNLWGNGFQSEEQAQRLAWALGMKREYVRV